MGKKLSAETVLCCFVFLSVVDGQCPYQVCYCSGSYIECLQVNLKTMPLINGTNFNDLQTLILVESSVTTIPDGSLPPGLAFISIQYTPVTTIDETAFDGSANTLNKLLFLNTLFTKIPNAFGRLKSLTWFQLSNNNVTDWNEDVMKSIGPTLQTLDLENVSFTEWPTWMQYFTNLSSLTIANNTISFLPDNALDNFVNSLTSLTLNNNQLTMIPKSLSKLNNLKNLNLQQNRISRVEWLPQKSKLFAISLRDNKLTDAAQLSQAMLPFASSLTSLQLDTNMLTSIPDFTNSTMINFFDFSFNRISDPFSGSLQPDLSSLNLRHNYLQAVPYLIARLISLAAIDLSFNSIKTIKSTDFPPKTTSVDLSYNLITELTDSSFSVNSSITYLQLNNNPLIWVSDGALKNLPNLQELSLQSTKITRLPLGLSYLNKLSTLDVSNIAGLVCTCLEKDLTDWFQKVTNPGQVAGDCGQTSVVNFFTALSSSCP